MTTPPTTLHQPPSSGGDSDAVACAARGQPTRSLQSAVRSSRSSAPQRSTQHPAPPTQRPTPNTLAAFFRQERASFGYAFEGVAYSWRTQRHLRVHAGIALVCVALGLWLRLGPTEWAALVAMIALVTAMEMLNTVVEVVVDMLSPAYHPGAKVAKDVAAGAVLISAGGAVLVGVFIFGPRLLALLR